MSKGFASRFRLGLLCVAVVAAFAGIGTRLVYLQVIERSKLVAQVDKARREVVVLKARRGDILDRNGNLLATSSSFMRVGVDPQSVSPKDDAKLPRLAALLQVPLADVKQAFSTKFYRGNSGRSEVDDPPRAIRWTKLADAIPESTYDAIKKLGIRGVYGNREFRRTYPGGSLAAHIIGFVNRENVAACGVERYMDFYLRGQDGWVETEKDGLRHELAQFRSIEIRPTNGLNVVLSIDGVVQHIIETELQRIVDKYHPTKATIIVSNPHTGFVLGLADYPTYNLNKYNTAKIADERNIAVTDVYEPGSTFKIVPASGALNEHLVTTQTEFDCSVDTIDYLGRTLELPHDSEPHGVLSVADIIAKSSNRGAAHLGVVLGAQRLYQYARAFGFGQDTGWPLEGEVPGILHPVQNWDGLTITRLPMGHAVAVTPLQIHYAMSTIANNGILMRPRVVRKIVDANGNTVLRFFPIERRRVVTPAVARTMQGLLMRVVSPEGTAGDAAIPGFQVAGKTGTSEMIIDGHYSHTHHIGSFSGFFPASNARVAITVVVYDAQLPGIAYGSRVAAPSFKRIGEQLIQYLGINPPENPQTYATLEGKNRAGIP